MASPRPTSSSPELDAARAESLYRASYWPGFVSAEDLHYYEEFWADPSEGVPDGSC